MVVGGLVTKSYPKTLSSPGTVCLQAPLSMGFSGQEYWSGLPFSSLGDLPDRPRDQILVSCIAGRFFTSGPPGKPFPPVEPVCIHLYLSEI